VRHPLPPTLTQRLTALRERPIDPKEKGSGAGDEPWDGTVTAARIGAAKPPLHAAGFTYPLLTLHEDALRNNVEAMAAFCAAAGVELAPHGKTAMSPELAALQLSHGAWGVTVATIGQLRTYRAFGFPRLLLANELVDEAGIAWLAAELAADPGFEAYCYVDSLDGVSILDRVLTGHPAGRPLPVLVEIGHAAGRTGCRTDDAALAVAKAAAATGTLTVAGVAGYEGGIRGATQAETLGLVGSFSRRLRGLAGLLDAGDREPIVTAGGSVYYDVVAAELTAGGGGVTAILRSGAYITHDHGHYQEVSPAARGVAGAPELWPAIELWAQVLSRPEPGLALLNAGRRDVGSDAGLPVPLRGVRRDGGPLDLAGATVTDLNDQHAYVRLPEGATVAPGDLVGMGISHPCTTLDKWRMIPVVNRDDSVVDVVHAFF